MGALTDVLSDVRDSIDDTEELSSSAKDFKKSAGKFKKSSKSVIKAAKGNIFEFPVFVANSVPLDYATATVALLEQVYASYLQMAISINPIIDDETARKGAQFDHLRSDVNKYLECVDPTDMPYAYDACHAVYEENGIIAEFNLVNIEDATAKIINEAMDHEPLSEFDHFFSETYSGDGAGFFDGCEWIQEAKKVHPEKYSKPAGPKSNGQNPGSDNSNTKRVEVDYGTLAYDAFSGIYEDMNQSQKDWLKSKYSIYDADDYVDYLDKNMDMGLEKFAKQYFKGGEIDADVINKSAKLYWEKEKAELDFEEARERLNALDRQKNDPNSDEYRKAKADLKEAEANANLAKKRLSTFDNDRKAELAAKASQTRANNANAEATEKKNRDYEEDRERQIAKDEADIENKKAGTAKSKAEIEKLKRQGKWDEEDRELDKAKKLNDARVKTPQFLDESKIQKLNTMKPLMMSVDLNVVDKNGSLSRPVSYVIGVKCHTRLIDSSILPEVAAYPLKEMNKQLRKIKWRSGELKFGRDLLWKVKSKKQTASDARDKKRKWYRRLYELSHMSGDGVAAASIKNGKSPWANWWQDKLTGGNNKDVGHGLIPNATIIMSKSDVDMIKREKDIDLLSGSKAAKMCKELFLIGMVVIDEDAESVKVLFPDLHNDYDVMSIAAVKKQLAQLDTAGTKTRDIMKLLG